MNTTTVTARVGDHDLVIETGKMAKQANGSVVVRYGEMTMLATATMGNVRDGDFFPLTVDFEVKTYAAGRIPVTFPRREGRPGDRSVLVARMTDRPLRPLFPDGMRNEVQIVLTTLSTDEEGIPDSLCGLAASAALHISDIPFAGPVGSVRVGWVDGAPVINPTYEQLAESELDLMIAGTLDAITMVEAGAKEMSDEDLLTALEAGHEAIKAICTIQNELREQVGRPKTEVPLPVTDEALKARVDELFSARWRAELGAPGKEHHYDTLAQFGAEAIATLVEQDPELADREGELKRYVRELEGQVVRRMILDEGIRSDGRDMTTVRPIFSEAGLLPRVHGSGLFTRGETQVLTITTLGTVGDRKTLDWLYEQTTERYFHQYNFPPYSVGETRRMGSPGRREVGHGMLAQRALMPVLPDDEEFPYTMRVVSEVLESNGSSSMASVCGSTLSLMDAGVPIKAPVSGVAMGLLQEGDRNLVITDILGLEDHCGDMDFKVCGTENGITALQMDIKCSGLTREIMGQALDQAQVALAHIRAEMAKTLAEPRAEISPHAPIIQVLHINPEKIGTLIGPGGKTIKKIEEESGARLDIEQDGRVFVAAPNGEAGKIALDWIKGLTHEATVGEEYEGPVTRIFGFGAMVEILPGKEGLVHISRLAAERVGRVEDVVSIGDTLKVRVSEVDDQGRINLERTDIPIIVNLGDDGAPRQPQPRDRDRDRDRGGRGGRGGGRGGRGGGGGRDGGRGGGGGGRDRDRDRDRGGEDRPRPMGEGRRDEPHPGGDDPDRPAPRGQRDHGPADDE